MSLLTLPPEVLAIILKKLDTKSIYNLHETCSQVKQVICMPGVVKECHFSLNILASVKSLQSSFFRDICEHLNTLNLSGVSDLTKSSLLPALRKVKNLKELDVSYTAIHMPDVLDIIKLRPALKSLTINFTFSKKYTLTNELLLRYQETFRGLNKVHFVGSATDLLFGLIAVCVLNKADLSSLQYTICGHAYNHIIHSEDLHMNIGALGRLSEFKLFSLTNLSYDELIQLPYFQALDLNNYEVLIFQKNNYTSVHATPKLKGFISKKFDVEVNSLKDLESIVVGELNVILWHKEDTQFDEKFYTKLIEIAKEYLVFRIDCLSGDRAAGGQAPRQLFSSVSSRRNNALITTVPSVYTWYSVEQYCPVLDDYHDRGPSFKKSRVARQSLILNYDDLFREEDKHIYLDISFKETVTWPITLAGDDLFTKLRHLSLIGDVQYTSEFFNKLFENCDSLDTLIIIKPRGNFSVPTLLYNLPKSKSLKNLLIYVTALQFCHLFTLLHACKTLENVHLVSIGQAVENLPNPSEVFMKCDNLYSICIRANLIDVEKSLKDYLKVRSKLGKNHINIVILPINDHGFYSPHFGVFNVFHLKPMYK